jgi:hypothetical protein
MVTSPRSPRAYASASTFSHDQDPKRTFIGH